MTARLRRCPACRLAGREGRNVSFGWTDEIEQSWHVVCQCGARSSEHSSTLKAQGAWNALSRAAKRGMPAKGGTRTAAVVAAARELVGKPVYIVWRGESDDWHWYDLLAVDGDCLFLRGLAAPDGTPWRGSPWYEPARYAKSIRALRDGEA